MKKILVVISAIFFAITTFAQTRYEKTYERALRIAQEKNRPIVIYIVPVGPQAKLQSGKFPVAGIDSAKTAEFYNNEFVIFKTTMADSSALPFIKKYKLTRYPALIFLDSKGYLLLKDVSGSIFSQRYLELGKKAIVESLKEKTLGSYQQAYLEGKVDQAFLKEFINVKKRLGLFDNARLIDEYVEFLKVSDLNSYDEVLFILQAGPYIQGKAYTLAYANRKLIDSIYVREPNLSRALINENMRDNTLEEAIRTKNQKMAGHVASFIITTQKSSAESLRLASAVELYYSKSVKDTTRYMAIANYYYDRYYMSIGVDSARKIDQYTNDQRIRTLMAEFNTNVNSYKKIWPGIVDSAALNLSLGKYKMRNSVAITLNTGAWDIYTLGIRSADALKKAVIWSNQSIKINPLSDFYVTLAHLMYAQNLINEAILNQEKAVASAIKEQRSPEDVKRILATAMAMKSRRL